MTDSPKKEEDPPKNKRFRIQIKAFYVRKVDLPTGYIGGSMHVHIENYGMDIRGIFCSRKNNKWKVQFPFFKTLDPLTQQIVQFPIINFPNRLKHNQFKKELRLAAKEYLDREFEKSPQSEGQSTQT